MHILYVYQYFTTRQGIGHTRAYEFAKQFVKQGHRVTVVTAGASTDNFTDHQEVTIDGITVIKLRAGYSDYIAGTHLSYSQRIKGFLDFSRKSAAFCLRYEGLKDVDVMYASSPPLTIAMPALLVSQLKRVPLVFEVRDCWPEAPIQMGVLKNPVLIRSARFLEKAAYNRSDHIVALSPGMRDTIIATGVDPAKVSVVPNCADLDLFHPDIDGAEVRERLGTRNKFVCLYFGAMGEANGLSAILDSAEILKKQDNRKVAIVLHGDGKERQDLETQVQERGLQNVIFSTPLPNKEAIAKIVASADVCLTHYKNIPILYTCSPNKLFDALSAGKPVIVNTPGWTRPLLEENRAGFYIDPNNPADLVSVLSHLSDHPEVVMEYGHNARLLAEREFDRALQASRLLEVLENASRSRHRRSSREATNVKSL